VSPAVRKLGLLASLYFSQGLPFGFFFQALPVILREQRVDLGKIGLSTLLALPWALKFVWAPLVDRVYIDRWGPRRSWILPLQLLSVVLLGALSAFDPAQGLAPLLVAVGLTSLVAATQDVASDGLAVELLEPHERGLGNGIQVGGFRLGSILGGGVLLGSIELLGWRLTCLLMAGALVLASVPVLLHREPPRRETAPEATRPSVRGFLRQPGVLGWLAVVAAYKAPDALATAMLRPFLVDEGLGKTEIGWMVGTAGFSAGLLGAVLGGVLLQRLGRRRSLVVFGILQAAGVACYAAAAVVPCGLATLTGLCAYEHFAGGMATCALFTVMMDTCRREAAATDYTVQACVVVIATGAASAASGFLAQALGYGGHFSLAFLLCLASTAWIGLRDWEGKE